MTIKSGSFLILLATTILMAVGDRCSNHKAYTMVTMAQLAAPNKWFIQTTNAGQSICSELSFTPSQTNSNDGLLKFRTIRKKNVKTTSLEQVEHNVFQSSYYLENVSPGQYHMWNLNSPSFVAEKHHNDKPYANAKYIAFTPGQNFVMVACLTEMNNSKYGVTFYYTATTDRRIPAFDIERLDSVVERITDIDPKQNKVYVQHDVICKSAFP
ncbi:hypothetical protein CHUAL_008177 [Chamberlinius hualienensis]